MNEKFFSNPGIDGSSYTLWVPGPQKPESCAGLCHCLVLGVGESSLVDGPKIVDFTEPFQRNSCAAVGDGGVFTDFPDVL